MPGTSRLTLLAASAAAAAALVAGCGSGSSPSSTPPPAASSTQAPAAPAAGTVLMTASTSALGTVVTDGSGHTLYRFDKDTAQPPVSNCNGSCATTWPPATVSGAPDAGSVKGIDAKLVSTVTRADGTQQLTLNGWPLYRYSADTKAGDTKGQGVQGIWFAATPTGDKASAPAAPASPSGGNGY